MNREQERRRLGRLEFGVGVGAGSEGMGAGEQPLVIVWYLLNRHCMNIKNN